MEQTPRFYPSRILCHVLQIFLENFSLFEKLLQPPCPEVPVCVKVCVCVRVCDCVCASMHACVCCLCTWTCDVQICVRVRFVSAWDYAFEVRHAKRPLLLSLLSIKVKQMLFTNKNLSLLTFISAVSTDAVAVVLIHLFQHLKDERGMCYWNHVIPTLW